MSEPLAAPPPPHGLGQTPTVLPFVTDRRVVGKTIAIVALVPMIFPRFVIRPLSGGDTTPAGIAWTAVSTVAVMAIVGFHLYNGTRRSAYIASGGVLSKYNGVTFQRSVVAELAEVDRVQIDAHVVHGPPARLTLWVGDRITFVSLHALCASDKDRLLGVLCAAGLQPADVASPYPLLR